MDATNGSNELSHLCRVHIYVVALYWNRDEIIIFVSVVSFLLRRFCKTYETNSKNDLSINYAIIGHVGYERYLKESICSDDSENFKKKKTTFFKNKNVSRIRARLENT